MREERIREERIREERIREERIREKQLEYLVTAAEMKACDRNTTEGFGVPLPGADGAGRARLRAGAPFRKKTPGKTDADRGGLRQ